MSVQDTRAVLETLQRVGVDVVFPVFVAWYLLSRVAPILIKLQRSVDVLLALVEQRAPRRDSEAC